MVRVEQRLTPLLFVWRAKCLAIRVDHEGHALLEPHVHELDCCRRRRDSLDCVREVRGIAEEVGTVERLLAQEMPKSPNLFFNLIRVVSYR